ncbi:hypothetical protein ETA_15210 [Erwinia tasmaniensis Et1/99]|uniref:Uncharacterized protein n=1 Tax=Erwinia tasmaniensis (strain DSM 17950 / CFBP 7177 / CIP 109463 / NCPPB 4357 / Et1/99) TaxID=465817 RepID=B2VJ61_ERWT9|nr:hypothetical protein ETA_15210 [Erwinia tasmaniensis Et1/99]
MGHLVSQAPDFGAKGIHDCISDVFLYRKWAELFTNGIIPMTSIELALPFYEILSDKNNSVKNDRRCS